MAWDDLIEKVTVEECHEGSEGMNCMMLGRRTFTQRHDECLVCLSGNKESIRTNRVSRGHGGRR